MGQNTRLVDNWREIPYNMLLLQSAVMYTHFSFILYLTPQKWHISKSYREKDERSREIF